jgi:hypothetical protein
VKTFFSALSVTLSVFGSGREFYFLMLEGAVTFTLYFFPFLGMNAVLLPETTSEIYVDRGGIAVGTSAFMKGHNGTHRFARVIYNFTTEVSGITNRSVSCYLTKSTQKTNAKGNLPST